MGEINVDITKTASKEEILDDRADTLRDDEEISVDIGTIRESLKKISQIRVDNYTKVTEENIENTFEDMLSVIKNLERHLTDLLEINGALKAELSDSRKKTSELEMENRNLAEKLSKLENDIPNVKDLENRLDLTNEEVERYKQLYKNENDKSNKLSAKNDELNAMLTKTQEERDDAYKEIIAIDNKKINKG